MIENHGDYVVIHLEMDHDFFEDLLFKADDKDIDIFNYILQVLEKNIYKG